ncbi:MAG TPA: hypothetical protein VHO06_17810, partial [Polyangia bacterium]|nr:hypothetical protein [Polyangia bacterium]
VRSLPFAGGGEIGLFADPDGNVLGLWKRTDAAAPAPAAPAAKAAPTPKPAAAPKPPAKAPKPAAKKPPKKK